MGGNLDQGVGHDFGISAKTTIKVYKFRQIEECRKGKAGRT